MFELCTRLTMKHGLGLTRQAISQHLDVLESAGLVMTRREGRYKFHYINTDPLKAIVERWLKPGREERHNEDRGDERLRGRPGQGLRFYTEILGFVKKTEVPMGEDRWLTVVAPEDPNGTELLLEPDAHPAVGPFKRALVEDGIPFTSFAVEDVQQRVRAAPTAGVHFTQPPVEMGPVTTAVLDDTCGNLIQIAHTEVA